MAIVRILAAIDALCGVDGICMADVMQTSGEVSLCAAFGGDRQVFGRNELGFVVMVLASQVRPRSYRVWYSQAILRLSCRSRAA